MKRKKIQTPIQWFRMLVSMATLLAIASPTLPAQAIPQFLYVTPAGTGTCLRNNPCSLAVGLSLANTDDYLIAGQGIYTATSGDQIVLLTKTIKFLGGWDGGTEGTILRNGVSILDGENERRVMTINGGPGVEPIVDGWTIRNGNASGLTDNCDAFGPVAGCGGGIHIFEAQPIITNNILENNTAAVAGGSNYAAGGGIYIDNSDGAIISENIIRNNNAHKEGIGVGGGIYVYNSGIDTEISNNEIYENDDYDSPTYFNHSGNAIHIRSNSGPIQVLGNYIHDNNPLDENYSGSAISLSSCSNNVVVENNRIVDNYGLWGVVELNYSTSIIRQNTIINPGAQNGIYIFDTVSLFPAQTASVQNNILTGHEDNNIFIQAYDDHDARVQLSHNTLADAPYGLYIGAINADVTVTFDRGIVSGHSLTGVYSAGNPGISVTVTNSLFYANTLDCDASVVNVNPLTGDPQFADPSAYNYHLRRGSAAIDRVASGGLAVDIDGDPRPFGVGTLAYDVGADEFIFSDFLFLPITIRP